MEPLGIDARRAAAQPRQHPRVLHAQPAKVRRQPTRRRCNVAPMLRKRRDRRKGQQRRQLGQPAAAASGAAGVGARCDYLVRF